MIYLIAMEIFGLLSMLDMKFYVSTDVKLNSKALAVILFFGINGLLFFISFYASLWSKVGRSLLGKYMIKFFIVPLVLFLSVNTFFYHANNYGFYFFIVFTLMAIDPFLILEKFCVMVINRFGARDLEFLFNGKYPEASADLFKMDLVAIFAGLYFLLLLLKKI